MNWHERGRREQRVTPETVRQLEAAGLHGVADVARKHLARPAWWRKLLAAMPRRTPRVHGTRRVALRAAGYRDGAARRRAASLDAWYQEAWRRGYGARAATWRREHE